MKKEKSPISIYDFGIQSAIVAQYFKWYSENNYITSRDGNAAWRSQSGNFWVTESGVNKTTLKPTSFVEVDENAAPVGTASNIQAPSIESAAHIAILKTTGKQCSVHVHSPNTVALTALFAKGARWKPGPSELKNVLNHKWPELFRYTKVGSIVPFLPPGSFPLHNAIEQNIVEEENDDGTKTYNDILILERHGVIVVGDSFGECHEHIVRLEHISGILLQILSASGGDLTYIL